MAVKIIYTQVIQTNFSLFFRDKIVNRVYSERTLKLCFLNFIASESTGVTVKTQTPAPDPHLAL